MPDDSIYSDLIGQCDEDQGGKISLGDAGVLYLHFKYEKTARQTACQIDYPYFINTTCRVNHPKTINDMFFPVQTRQLQGTQR